MSLNVSISNVSILLADEDFFNVNSYCSIDNCSVLILVFLVLVGTILSLVLFFIVKRLRSRNNRLYVQVRAVRVKSIEKDLKNKENGPNENLEFFDYSNNMSNIVNTTNCNENLPKNAAFKILTEESQRKQNTTITTAKTQAKEDEKVQKPKESYLMEKEAGKKAGMSKNESASSKGSKRNYFNEKFENKSQMFGDDSSIQYEDDSFHGASIEHKESFDEAKKEITCSVQAYLNEQLNSEQNPYSKEENLGNNSSQSVNKEELIDTRLRTILEENEGNNETLRIATN